MKKTITIFSIFLALALPAQAQILLGEDEQSLRAGTESDFGVLPLNGVTYDQTNETYTPIGEGIVLLTVLGTAYLLGKRNLSNNNK